MIDTVKEIWTLAEVRGNNIHPVSKELIELEAPLPEGNLWKGFAID